MLGNQTEKMRHFSLLFCFMQKVNDNEKIFAKQKLADISHISLMHACKSCPHQYLLPSAASFSLQREEVSDSLTCRGGEERMKGSKHPAD